MGVSGSPVTVRDCPHQLARIIEGSTSGIVGIDGCVGAGKTWLAFRLAELSGGLVIDLDSYLNKKQDCFVEAIRLTELKSAIEEAIAMDGPIFISGACLKAALSKINVDVDFTVYVEKRSSNVPSLPDDLDFLDCEENGNISSLDAEYFSNLDREIGQYHADFRPKSHADVVYLRTERTEDIR